ncbi:hypothetical protein TRVL_09856 [Trypanosoma vivax]|nr:hypothetical protein TRVL_09856 [Trypanosoma vivax]
MNAPGPLQHRRVVWFFGAINDALQVLCLRKPGVERVFGREDAVRHFRMHWTFGPQSQVMFQRSPMCHLVDRLQSRLAQGILPIGGLWNARNHVRRLCLNPLQPLVIRQRCIEPPGRDSVAHLGLHQCKVECALPLPFRTTLRRRHCSELQEPRVGRCLRAHHMLAQPLVRLHGETKQLQRALLL